MLDSLLQVPLCARRYQIILLKFASLQAVHPVAALCGVVRLWRIQDRVYENSILCSVMLHDAFDFLTKEIYWITVEVLLSRCDVKVTHCMSVLFGARTCRVKRKLPFTLW